MMPLASTIEIPTFFSAVQSLRHNWTGGGGGCTSADVATGNSVAYDRREEGRRRRRGQAWTWGELGEQEGGRKGRRTNGR